MPRPHTPTIHEIELIRKINSLSTKLLQANVTLRIKTIYCERLEFLLREGNERIDQLTAKLDYAHTIHQRLERECEHLSQIIATAPARLFAHKPQTPHTPANQNTTHAPHSLA
jgi:hypothetical protein